MEWACGEKPEDGSEARTIGGRHTHGEEQGLANHYSDSSLEERASSVSSSLSSEERKVGRVKGCQPKRWVADWTNSRTNGQTWN